MEEGGKGILANFPGWWVYFRFGGVWPVEAGADIIREMVRAGWVLGRVRGSRRVFKHPDRPGHVVVAHPKKDFGRGVVVAIRERAGC
jgi:predicted RNA binding protein YcfA (HicA-like mRNA interferase family)